VYVSVADCEYGAPSCPTCIEQMSEEDVMNCPKQQCNSTLVCRLLDSFIHLFGVAALRFDSLVRSTTATIAFCQCQCKCCYSLQGSTWRLSVCLSVCLVATSRTNNHRIFTKLLRVMYLWTRKNLLNVGSHPFLDPYPGIYKRLLEHCKR